MKVIFYLFILLITSSSYSTKKDEKTPVRLPTKAVAAAPKKDPPSRPPASVKTKSKKAEPPKPSLAPMTKAAGKMPSKVTKEPLASTPHITCPICTHKGPLKGFGPNKRLAACSKCGSVERHRLFWLWFQGKPSKLKEPILHFAAERALVGHFRKLYKHYKTADLFNEADLKLDIEAIDLPDKSQSTVICNHVLEHVADRKALKEIYRVLADGGQFIVSVPIVESMEKTYEDDSITEPALRLQHFGQADHVRLYGRDFRDRLNEVGFSSIAEKGSDAKMCANYGLRAKECFFICTK